MHGWVRTVVPCGPSRVAGRGRSDQHPNRYLRGGSQMDKKRTAAVVIVLLACGLATRAFAQDQGPKFNSDADDISKISNLLEDFRLDVIHKDGDALRKLLLNPNVLFHSIDDQASVDTARKLNPQFDGIGPSLFDGFVTLLATSKDKLEERVYNTEIRQD